MPSISPGLSAWLQPGVMGAGLAIIWAEVRAQGRRIDELRADMKASEVRQDKRIDELRVDMKASEVRQRQDIAELKADNRVLGEKLDRLLEGLLAARQP